MLDKFTILLTSADIAASPSPRAIINKTTESIRGRLDRAHIDYSHPFKEANKIAHIPASTPTPGDKGSLEFEPSPQLLDNYPASVVVMNGDANIRKLLPVIFEMLGVLGLYQEAKQQQRNDEAEDSQAERQGTASLSMAPDDIPATILQNQEPIYPSSTPSPLTLMGFDDLPTILSPVCPFLHSTLRRLDSKMGSMKAFNQKNVVRKLKNTSKLM